MENRTTLKRDHRRIRQLFTEFESLPERAYLGRWAIFKAIDGLVRCYLEDRDTALQANSRDGALLGLLDELAEADYRDDRFIALMRELRDAVEECAPQEDGGLRGLRTSA